MNHTTPFNQSNLGKFCQVYVKINYYNYVIPDSRQGTLYSELCTLNSELCTLNSVL